jgi:hypothetical protein
MSVLRDGNTVPVEITTSEREPAVGEDQELKDWGMTGAASPSPAP